MLSKEISQFVTELDFRDIPQKVREFAALCLLDWVGCVAAALPRPSSGTIRDFVLDWGGAEEAGVAGSKVKVAAPQAALANGMMAHTVEYDDIFKDAIYHPGAPVIAAALAVAEKKACNGAELLKAIILGYEISNRIGAAVNPSHYEFFHTTGTVGTFGAAIASSVLMDLSLKEIQAALGLAGTQASGLWEVNGTDGKPLHAGKAAMSGVLSALLAARGLTGPLAILEGKQGFMQALAHNPDFQKVTAGLGTEYTILQTTFKYYASCGHTHAVIDATLDIIKNNEIRIPEIQKIRIYTYAQALEIAGNSKPETPYQGKFSIPYCSAVAIKYGQVRDEVFAEVNLHDPEICKLMQCTELYADDVFSAVFPKQRGARVEIITDSQKYEHSVACRKGDPENPLTVNDLREKFLMLSNNCLDSRTANHVATRLLNIGESQDVSWIMSVLAGEG